MNFPGRVYADPSEQKVRDVVNKVKSTGKRFVLIGIAAVIVFFLAMDSFFVVDQTERANVRRMGTRVYDQPLGPGLHFKLPLLDKADELTVTLTTLHIPPFKVTTVDNQEVTIEENFNYTIDDSAVNYLLYEVGKSGKGGIDDQIIPVAKERTGRIFARQNMANVNANREQVTADVTNTVVGVVTDLFKITPHSFQLASIIPSPQFMTSNEAAVKAKNDAVAEENKKVVESNKAAQMVIIAKGNADRAIEEARGRSESIKLEAEANYLRVVKEAESNLKRLTMEGEGQEKRLAAEIKPFGTPDKYIAYLEAQAKLRWDGKQPQIVSGQGSGTNLVIPIQPNTK